MRKLLLALSVLSAVFAPLAHAADDFEVKDASGATIKMKSTDTGARGHAPWRVIEDGGNSITVDATALPLPTGAATAAKQPALGTAGAASTDVLTVQGIASMTPFLVDNSANTQPISASALPLPTGAATSANQTTIIGHVDGIEALLAGTLTVDGSGVTQPISGVVTANLGATDNAVLDNIDGNTNGTTTYAVTLLTNGSATGSSIAFARHGSAIWKAQGGTWSGATAQLQYENEDTGTWIDVPGAALTADGAWCVPTTGLDNYRIEITGSPTNIDSVMQWAGTAPCSANDQSALATSANQATGNASLANIEGLLAAGGTATTSVTRPADTTAYAQYDVWADSTSAPTAGGFTLSNMCSASGGSGIITDINLSNSVVQTTLEGWILIFDSAPTAVNDNATLALSDADELKLVKAVPFDFANGPVLPSNSTVHLGNLALGYTCVGSANLRFLVYLGAAHTPTSAEVLTVRAKFVTTD